MSGERPVELERGAFAGQITDLPVAELLRMIARGRQTGSARFETTLGSATLWFREGELVDAEMGCLLREAAVERLLQIESGTFEVELKPVTGARMIERALGELLEAHGFRVDEGGDHGREDGKDPAGPKGKRRRPPVDGWRPTAGGLGRQNRPQKVDTAPPAVRSTEMKQGRPGSPALAPQELVRRIEALQQQASRQGSSHPALGELGGSGAPATGPRGTAMGIPIPKPVAAPPTPPRAQNVNDTGAATSRTQPGEDESGPISVGFSFEAPNSVLTRQTGEHEAVSDDAELDNRDTIVAEVPTGRGQTMIFRRPTPPVTERVDASAPPRGRTAMFPPVDRSPAEGTSRPRRKHPQQRAQDVARAIGMPGPEPIRVNDPPRPQRVEADASSPRAPGTPAAPAIVGRYEVLLRLARGGMGTVYLCRVTGEGGFRRLFALKVIRDHLCRNDEYGRMLLQEARIASRLHHPNVVGIVDIGILANQHYLVMEYVEGCTFSELLKFHRKSRPPQLVVPIVLDALTGLHAAHTLTDDDGRALGFVHCDFSPQNMLVGTNGVCRITDFGISRAANALPERPSITRGKPAYLSPEQILGRHVDHRADIFAAGVVLWNALTGEQLFSGETPEEIIEEVLHADIPPPSTVGLRPPKCLDRVCLRALRRDPGARYQSAEEMLVELRRISITEDLLGTESEVAEWVTQTFGAQLEMRRQAAGIATATPAPEAFPSVQAAPPSPEHASAHLEHETPVLVDAETDPPGGSASQTAMLRPRSGADTGNLIHKQRSIVLALAAAVGLMAIVIAFMRPDWIRGGFVDGYGTYLEYDPIPVDDEVESTKEPEKGANSEEVGSAPKAKKPVPPSDARGHGAAEGVDTPDASGAPTAPVASPPDPAKVIESGTLPTTEPAAAPAPSPPDPAGTTAKLDPKKSPRSPDSKRAELEPGSPQPEPEAEPEIPEPSRDPEAPPDLEQLLGPHQGH